ncbi:MAG TPA: CehA/McbA family metallohydrolase [Planctomycetota bacterium]|nr:CehA/McbA family metallohydrolase [Planctomycetota bacterium]
MKAAFCSIVLFALSVIAPARGADLPFVKDVDAQPLWAQARRVMEALDYLGNPISAETKASLQTAADKGDGPALVKAIQDAFDSLCLVGVNINPESRVKVAPGPAAPQLVEQGWRQFLLKVQNDAGVTAQLQVSSPNARPMANSPQNQLADLWFDGQLYSAQPLTKNLTGLALEYRIIQLYSRDAGKREARLGFNVGQGTQDLGFRDTIDILFTSVPARDVTLHVLDEIGQPATARFTIRDKQNRVYPSQAKRLAPDFAFHPQIYREDGEVLKLPDGTYSVEITRGPEYVAHTRTLTVNGPQTLTAKLERWIDPSKLGWWSGDHHIHAAGCAHYTKPSEGVHAPDMMRHCLGEDLKVGCNLTWGPCFDYQKQFFTGEDDKVSKYPYLLRYDIEVSGFGSHQSGHLCLLRLKNQMYPGGTSDKHWPTLCLNTLRWAKKQGAVVGPAHSGWGLKQDGTTLPTYQIPPYDGIGANEYIVDVTHLVPGPDGNFIPAVDFMSTVDTPYVWELNMWYHTLNCGFRTRASGETDFPCIYGERVGLGRSYVKLDGKLTYADWCEGIRNGRNYVSDGFSHLIDFKADSTAVGENESELKLAQPATIKLSAKVAALLNEKSDESIRAKPFTEKPYWNLERARIGQSREVPVEVIVNGYPVAKKTIVADGKMQEIDFDVKIERSSWVALRILPSSHTNPIFVLVGDKPIRASKRSAEWCLKGVDQCWSQKEKFIAPAEHDDAVKAYDHAREVYRKIVAESDVE